MALNRECIGRVYRYPASDAYEIGREHIRKFADAIGDANPLYRDRGLARAAGYRDIPAPPTFLAVIPYARVDPFGDPELGIDKTRGLHAGHRFVHHRPAVAGDQVLLELTVADMRTAGVHEILELRGEARTVGGELLTTITHTTIFRGDPQPGASRKREPEPVAVDPDAPTIAFEVTRHELLKYSGASGEFEPIHWSDVAARAAGLDGVIAHGLFTLAKAGQAATAWAGDPGRVVELNARFIKPLVIPEVGSAPVVVRQSGSTALEGTRRRVELDVETDGGRLLDDAYAVLA
jgi:acyl dehydratase